MNRRAVLIEVIARMLGVEQAELERDDNRRRRLYRTLLYALAFAFVAAMFFTWDYLRPKTRYFIDYIEVYGVPVGICEIDEVETLRMSAHYEIVSSQNMVREISHRNSSGSLVVPSGFESMDRPSKMTYEYRNDGSLSKTTYYDQWGKQVISCIYNSATKDQAIVDYVDAKGKTVAQKLSVLSGTQNATQSQESYDSFGSKFEEGKIARLWLFYDSNGYEKCRCYLSNPVTNAIAEDDDGISKLQFTRDDLGRVTRVEYWRYIGDSGVFDVGGLYSDYSDSNTVLATIFTYDELSNLTKICFFGKK